jgi:uncharacterized ParB-like nuclease family protein
MKPILRILLVTLVAAVAVSAVISAADARPKKPGGTVTKPKQCTAEGETMESGSTMDVLEQTSKGVVVRSYTCNNGKVCLKAYDEKGKRLNGDGDCWMSPATVVQTSSSGANAAPPVGPVATAG